jgi:hypothetical protein
MKAGRTGRHGGVSVIAATATPRQARNFVTNVSLAAVAGETNGGASDIGISRATLAASGYQNCADGGSMWD